MDLRHAGPVLMRRPALAVALVALLSATAASRPSLSGGLPPAGFWRGHGETVRVSSIKAGHLDAATLRIRYITDFWFTSDGAGRLSGEAAVRYEMTLDDSRLRGLIGLINTTSDVGRAYIPLVGPVLGVGSSFSNILGMTSRYDEGSPLRHGRITGSIRGTELHLEWAEPPATLPYRVTRVYPTTEEIISQRSGPAYSPWEMDGAIRELIPGEWDASVTPSRSSGSRGDLRWSSYWYAARLR